MLKPKRKAVEALIDAVMRKSEKEGFPVLVPRFELIAMLASLRISPRHYMALKHYVKHLGIKDIKVLPQGIIFTSINGVIDLWQRYLYE
jgi:hypothetical protein